MTHLLLLVAALALAAIDLNAATQADLETLPGIGPSKAAAILQYRTEHGAFKTLDELDAVPGFGPATLEQIRPLVSIGAAAADATASAAPATPSVATPAAGCPVNVNKADASALLILPGIGESKAAAIVQYRSDHGVYATCDELDAVSGIGPATLAAIRDCCVVK